MSRHRPMRSIRLIIAACTVTTVCCVACLFAHAEKPEPRTLMRVPRWIETLGEPSSARRPGITEAGEAAPRPDSTPIAFVTAAPKTDGKAEPSLITPEAAAELGIPRPAESEAAGRPGTTLLRSRAPAAVEGYARLAAGWADLADDKPTKAGRSPDNQSTRLTSDVSAPVRETPGRSSLGPERSVLRREPTPRTNPPRKTSSAPPKPLAKTATAPASAPDSTVTAEDSAARPTSPDVVEPAASSRQPERIASADRTASSPVKEADDKGNGDAADVDAADVTRNKADAGKTTDSDVPADAGDKPVVADRSATETFGTETSRTEKEEATLLPEETPTLAIDPASFRGVLPGKTTREELVAGWGEGESFTREDGSKGIFWKVEPFERVEVVLEGDTVASIFIRLNEPVPVAELARQLEISDLRTVTVLDDNGVSVGEVFPERGVVFSVKPGTHAAVAVMLEPLDAESFVLRSEADLDASVANALADLQYAIEIDPSHVRAHRLLLVILADQGKWRQAAEVAEAAARLDPADTWVQVKHASVLLALDRTDDARKRVETLLGRKNNPPLVTAQAERLLGRIELGANSPDHEKAVAHFGKAIKLSSPLTAAKSQAIRRAALDLQLDCHLGTALAIAGGSWQQKARVIPKWIDRSEGFAKKLGTEVGSGDMVELRLCEGVLAIAAKSSDVADSLSWVKRTMDVRGRLDERVTDPWRRRQIDWQVGQALNLALTAAQNRGDSADLLENATLTAAYLERGSQMRQLTPREQRMLGDLYFRIGILHSLQNGDHATAVAWFDRTVPLWKENPSFERTGDLGRLGESYVSMAISYWQVEKRPEAVKLSRLGVEGMVNAVERGQLEERALAVAYGNLSTMYAEQGDAEQSKAYAEMASRAEATGTVIK